METHMLHDVLEGLKQKDNTCCNMALELPNKNDLELCYSNF